MKTKFLFQWITRTFLILTIAGNVFSIPDQSVSAKPLFAPFTNCASQTQIPKTECDALVAFYNATGGAGWTNNSGWLNDNTPCSWYGITCGNGTNITALSFSSNNLIGNIPPGIGSLTSLQELSLNSNQLSGIIPTEIMNLISVSSLDLSYNLLTASDSTLLTYLNTKDPDWATTQTVHPLNVQVISTTSNSIELSWTAIPYTGDGGYYEIGWATGAAGPYTIHGMTADKATTGYVVSNLSPGGYYYIRVRTYTPMHGTQQNDLWSEYTLPISANAINPVPILNGILPDHKDAGDGGFNLALDGANFSPDAKVLWNGVELVTTFSSSSQLSAAVTSLLLQSPGIVDVAVRNPAPGGGTSNTLLFNVNPYTNSWMAHSPEGGVINDIDVDRNNPLVMYAATDVAGVYKSVDGGQNWFAVNNGIDATGPLGDIVVSPSNSSIVMTSGANTYLSKNGGASWTYLLYNGNLSTNCIRFNAQNPDIITLGTSHGLLQTQDGGSTWQDIGKFPGHYIFAVEVDQQTPGTIYEIDIDPVVYSHTVWKTIDGGNSWNQLTGLPVFISHLKIDPSNPSILYAATMRYETAAEYGIYKSVDGGDTWTQVVSDSLHYTSIVIDSSNPNQVYVAADNGVYRTSDGGLNWEFNAPQKFRDVTTLAIAEANPTVLFGAGFHGVFKSLDSGMTWSPVNTGLYAHQIVDLAYSPDSNTLFAATKQGGVWRSTDYGASWNHIDHDMPFLELLRMDPNDTDHLFVSAGGIQESKDGGQTWISRSFPYSFKTFAANSDLFAVASDGPFGPEHIFKSSDNGDNWVKKSDLPVCANTCRTLLLVADPLDPNTLYASAFAMDPISAGRSHLYKTSDGGESWVQNDNGAGEGTYEAFAIDPSNTSVLYLGTSWGIYKSIDGGGNWANVGNYANFGIKSIFAMAVDPTNDQIIYAGGVGVYRSIDGGTTWTDFNYGLNSGVVWTILPIPAPPPQAAASRAKVNAQAASQDNSVSRVFSVAGGQVYAYFTIAINTSTINFGAISQWTNAFDLSHGWTVQNFVRTVGDVNNDGRADLIGFGLDGVYVALSDGAQFGAISKWTSAFDLSHGWTVQNFVRTVGDVSGDGKADLVGFGADGVYVAVSTGTGFGPVTQWSTGFGLANGWTVQNFVRTVGDVTGDGKADLVGFGADGVYVAVATGTGFGPVTQWSTGFGLANGWTVQGFVRTVGDVSGDGKADLVGFGADGVYVAVATGTGFGPVSQWSTGFGLANGWTVQNFVRTVGDISGDGKADLVGFGADGVYVAIATGTGFGPVAQLSTGFGLANGWTVQSFVRTVGDVNKDGNADLVGFGKDGVYVALAQ